MQSHRVACPGARRWAVAPAAGGGVRSPSREALVAEAARTPPQPATTVKRPPAAKPTGRTTMRMPGTSKGRAGGADAADGAAAPRRSSGSQAYFAITGFPFPLGPFFQRNTIRREVERDSVWVFEQTQALEAFSVYTPVRMTVIKLASGGLWVHAPVAPTDECVRLLKELGAPVEYIVLPTFAYEHKVFVGPFSRRFPKAKVYVAPFQWSYPLNLPPQFFGIFPAGELATADPNVPWADEIEQKVFLPPSIGVGDYVRFSEVAFFHKRSRTLLVTDAVVFVPEDPPEVIPQDALLELARDGWLAQYIRGGLSAEEAKAIAQTGPVEDSREARRKGWQRMALLVLYFSPSNLLTPQESFAAISNRLMVGPVVETLVYSKIPKSVVEWVEAICADWSFRQIIPCHFEAPVRAGPAEFRRAFSFAYERAYEDGLLPAPEEVVAATAAAAAPALPAALPGPLAGLVGGLLGALRGAGVGGGSDAPLTRPVFFPPEDIKTLENLNRTLLSLGAVTRNADLDAQFKAEEAAAKGGR